MSQALYEQYKEALRRGHVAALRGRLDVAEAAYRTAAAIAPDRALPFVSLAGVLRRRDQLDEALGAYDAALARIPGDEGALRGRAELHADAGRRSPAASDLDALSLVLERAGRLADALGAASRALDLAESRARRRDVERLRSLVVALEAGGVDEPIVSVPVAADGAPASATPDAEPVLPPDPEPLPPPDAAHLPPPDQSVLRAVADALLDSGDLAGATDRYLALAVDHRSAGRFDAAMDTCLALLAASPSDHRLQLEIAAIQVDRGWLDTAAEKVRLLARLADLDDDAVARAAVEAFATERGLSATGAADAG